ncbi:MAG: beta-lactamase family protein [Candidatus Aminicenantes bacterium]|nr:beta-lactamase family protein [Candidatus Aminicenantes bacterium]
MMTKRTFVLLMVLLAVAALMFISPLKDPWDPLPATTAPTEADKARGQKVGQVNGDFESEEDWAAELAPSTLGDDADVEPAPSVSKAPASPGRAARAVRAQDIDRVRLAAELTPEIDEMLRVGRIPSAAVTCVAGDRIVWSSGRGFCNLRTKTRCSTDTVFLIGSTFKTMSTVALLQQLDAGKFRLDDPVNEYLTEFKIENENPLYPVTFRHLLTHTSGLPTDFGRHSVWADEGPPSLADYLRDNLRLQRRPGRRVVYSNTAFALVAYLVERFSGQPFKSYMRTQIFAPVGMRDTEFEPRADMAERLAIPYMKSRRGRFWPVDWVKADVWAAGVVYGTSVDLGRWLLANLNGGLLGQRRLLAESTFREMTTRQYSGFAGPINGGWLNETTAYGLTWWISGVDGETYIAHSGSVNGYTAFCAGNLDRRTGVAILTNGNKAHRYLYDLALKVLDALGDGGGGQGDEP